MIQPKIIQINIKQAINELINKGEERTVNAKKNIIGLAGLKGIDIIIGLILIPLTIGYINQQQYGIWITLSSLVSWLGFFDIGFGRGLQNKFAEAIALGEEVKAKIYVSTTYAITSIIIISLWILLSITIFFLNWSDILNAPKEMAEELKFVAFIVSTTFCFQLILKLITTILTALQSPALASLINTITQGLILLIISLSIITSEKGSLLILSLITGLIQLGTLLVVSIFLFSKKLKHYRPQRKYVKFEYAKDLMTLGLKFFFLQILSLLFYSTNNIIIAQINGPEDVTIYNIAYRYMNVMLMIFSIIITPFWSAFTEAKTKNDIPWMNDSYKKLLILYIAIIIIGLIMTLISSPIYKIWLGSKVIIPFYLTLSLFIFNAINIWGTLFDTLIYGIGKIKLTMYKSMFICIINVPITILGCKSAGMIGLVIAQIIIAIPFIWMGPYQTKKLINNKADGIWNK